MRLSLDELQFLRSVYGLAPFDVSADSQIASLTANVPSEPGFYRDLRTYSQQLGIDPTSLLIVIASESGFSRGKIGGGPAVWGTEGDHDLTPRGLVGFTAANVSRGGLGGIMSWQEWDALPNMTAQDQLKYVYLLTLSNMGRVGGRPFVNTFELYVSNAAPGTLRADPSLYKDSDVLYSGASWLTNLAIDNWPTNYLRVAMLRNELTEATTSPQAYAKKVAALKLIRGKVTFGDLRNYADRMNGVGPNAASWGGNPARWALAWNLALRRYSDVWGSGSPIYSREGAVEPRYVQTSLTVQRPGYTFDSRMPNETEASPPGILPSAGGAMTPTFGAGDFSVGSSWWGAVAGAGLMVGAVVAYAHLKK